MKKVLIGIAMLPLLMNYPASAQETEDSLACKNSRLLTERCLAAIQILRERLSQQEHLTEDKKVEPEVQQAEQAIAALNSLPIPRVKPGASTLKAQQSLTSEEEQQSNPAEEQSNPVPSDRSVATENTQPAWAPLVPFPTPKPSNFEATIREAQATQTKAKQADDSGNATDNDNTPEASEVATTNDQPRCLDPRSINEPDIRRAANALQRGPFCISETRLREGGFNWHLHIIRNTKRKGPLFVVPHDNEQSAFQAAIYGLGRYGGTLVAVEAGERRTFDGQDPNRNFGTTRAASATCPGQRSPAPKYTNTIMQHRKSGQPIIALHSNANGWSGNGGSGTISVKRKSRVMLPFVSAIAKSRFADEDTLVVIASTRPPGKDRKQTAALKHFTEKAGVNVLYEYVRPDRNDCSLSNYVVLNKLGDYFNVEVENGDVASQRKLLDIVMDYVR